MGPLAPILYPLLGHWLWLWLLDTGHGDTGASGREVVQGCLQLQPE